MPKNVYYDSIDEKKNNKFLNSFSCPSKNKVMPTIVTNFI